MRQPTQVVARDDDPIRSLRSHGPTINRKRFFAKLCLQLALSDGTTHLPPPKVGPGDRFTRRVAVVCAHFPGKVTSSGEGDQFPGKVTSFWGRVTGAVRWEGRPGGRMATARRPRTARPRG